jgi:hypothetical protein
VTLRGSLAIVVLGLLTVGVLWEPYTSVLHRSDVIIPAPFWQAAVAYIDIGILVAIATLSAKRRFETASVVMILELGFYLCRNAVLLIRDGWHLFIYGNGLGPVSVLSEYVVFLVLRALLIMLLVSSRSETTRAAAA